MREVQSQESERPEREVRFRAASILAAVSMVASVFEMFGECVIECVITSAQEGWPVAVRLRGAKAGAVRDELLRWLAAGEATHGR